MYEHKKIQQLNDFFLNYSARHDKGIYFYRINGYNEQIHAFVRAYFEKARTSGVAITGKLPNPNEKQLSYYNEMMGQDFVSQSAFFQEKLAKWLPRMSRSQRVKMADSIYDCLTVLKQMGKNDNMLKNAYIKFMCWLYYKFEPIVNRLGMEEVPKILYEGEIGNYELLMFSVLAGCGCDIVLLQYHGDENYKKLDDKDYYSDNLNLDHLEAFPPDFSLEKIMQEIREEKDNERLYGPRAAIAPCTNVWIDGKGLEDCKKSVPERGKDTRFYYNCFICIYGAEDKLTYLNELYQLQLELKNQKRKILIVEARMAEPTTEEIGAIKRRSYQTRDQMLADISQNIRFASNNELQRLMHQTFLDVMLEEAKLPDMNLNKLTNRAVYLLCWMKRYQSGLFAGWQMPAVACFLYFGACGGNKEALFLKWLSRLPVDVMIFVPNLNDKCVLKDSRLYEIHYQDSMSVTHFPSENTRLHMGTTAYHAERELDNMMYQDSGIYRNRQYEKAISVTLRTMYEEIAILWDQEPKYRPNFSTVEDIVNIPVIFSKISGVKDRNMPQYWSQIKALLTPDTYMIKNVPYISSEAPNPMRSHAAEFFKNGKIQRARIKGHPQYPYGVLRDEVQDHILNKLQLLIDQKSIRGTFQNGMEYTIVATVLNLPKEIVRLIQQFDFTRKNPKLIYINTTEQVISLEDSIIAAFLNLIGFDVVFFVPTGYQTVEKYYDREIMEEHQIGDYVYDLHVPDFRLVSGSRQRGGQEHASLWDKIFKRNGG